jgi:hypothetical protein
MGQNGMPATDHAEFDQLCRGLDEYDAMPNPQEDATRLQATDEPTEQLDDQILAGLVTP